MPGADNLVIQRGAILDLERLCSAIQSASLEDPFAPADGIQVEVIAELRACRPQIANALDPSIDQLPSPEARSRLLSIGEGNVILHDDAIGANTTQPTSSMRLGADLVAVAIALSDELQINELDAAVLLFDARMRASHRPDHDVVAATKELYALRRRQRVQYLQEIIRAALITPSNVPQNEESFVSLLMRERDVLVVEHQVFANLVTRLHEGIQAVKTSTTSTRDPKGLYYGEYLLLAETIFLLAYTVQLTSAEALALRKLVDIAESFYSRVIERDLGHSKPGRIGVSIPSSHDAKQNWNSSPSELVSREAVEAEGVCNLLLLAWMCALDRSRYHDMYDPRTGQKGVNCLLKDLSFIPRTSGMPVVGDDDQEVRNMPKRIAAVELVAAVFRLAVATPDEEEAVGTFLRVSAYAGALSFVSRDVSSWIEKRGGSLSPDVDLYADVMEDLSLDIAEATHLVGAVIQFSQNEVYAAASEAAYASLDGSDMTLPQRPSQTLGDNRQMFNSLGTERPSSLRKPEPLQSTPGVTEQRLASRRSSFSGKPPRQPTATTPGRPSSLRDLFTLAPATRQEENSQSRKGRESDEHNSKSNVTTSENLIASLATFVARCVALAPSKLANDSIGGGLRYWVGIGQTNLGFISRIGDAVTDLWDASMRNAYATGGVGAAFREALESFLLLLRNTSLKNGSPTHAAAALRYLCQGGHPVVSLERTADAMSYIHGQMIRATSGSQKELDDAESEALGGILDVVSNAAEAVSSQSGVLPILGDAGKELPMRMGALVSLDIPVRLKATLLSALRAIGNRTVISLVLKNLARDKAALLRRFIRSTQSQTGNYVVTLKVLEMTNESLLWNEDEVPETAVESIIMWFVIEEVLMFWSRRKYAEEAQRWKLIHEATNLIISSIKRAPSSKSSRLLARLLTPAPGTGAASYALKALFHASGLMRTSDEIGSSALDESLTQSIRGYHKISGRACLNHAAELGMGDSFREMQKAARTASVLNRMLLSVPPGRLMMPGVVVAPASALILGETKALISASTLVFLANGFEPLYRKLDTLLLYVALFWQCWQEQPRNRIKLASRSQGTQQI
ncbi:Nucleoporin Nup186/Nup192/Nup205 [Gracilaria domingensis]|nr:Nucleoporin Nup186/Nup192/Nup205 [Gracilaria domingensis]